MTALWILLSVCVEDAAVLAAIQDASRRASAMAFGHPGPPLCATA
jgi:hypothetical protein